jgi:BMFP domain-containing protein YqiC
VVDLKGQAAELDTRRDEIVRLRSEIERLEARIAELETPLTTPVEAAPIAAVSQRSLKPAGRQTPSPR